METFERLESQVRGYSRSFPRVLTRALGSSIFDEDGREYLDFFAGAGVMSYGHNNPRPQGPAARVPGGRRAHPRARHGDGGQARLPAGLRGDRPAPARARPPRAVPGPGRRERRRVGDEAGPPGDRPRGDHLLHLRLPRDDPRCPVGERQPPRPRRGRRLAGPRRADALRRLPRARRGHDRGPRALHLRRAQRRRHAGGVPRGDRAGRGRRQRRERALAARARGARPPLRDPADRRRRAGGLRPLRAVLQLRGGRDHPRHRLPVQGAQRLRAADGGDARAAGVRRPAAGRAQRHLPRPQPRVRHRDGDAAALLAHARAHPGGRGQGSGRRRAAGAAGDPPSAAGDRVTRPGPAPGPRAGRSAAWPATSRGWPSTTA